MGGIPEAKFGVPYLIPVNVITQYKPALDGNLVPVAETPRQNIDPWAEALRADTRLYRNYRFVQGSALACPMAAYWGDGRSPMCGLGI